MNSAGVASELFLPRATAPTEEVAAHAALLWKAPHWPRILDVVFEGVLILNPQRQILYYNQAMADTFGWTRREDVIGKRLGDALGCSHFLETPGGACGCTPFCGECGAARALKHVSRNRPEAYECHIRRRLPDRTVSEDFRVFSRAMTLAGIPVLVFAILNISDQKRREVLERVFFHDIMNTIAVVDTYARLARDVAGQPDGGNPRADLANLLKALDRLSRELRDHQDLNAAEHGTLQPIFEPLRIGDVLHDVLNLYASFARDRKVNLVCADPDCGPQLRSDRTLLARVIGNMLKNGIEASTPGQTVTCGAEPHGDGVAFWVHNPTAIPPETQRQLFRRAFSTKGKGRGLGTYSIKLLGETYLQGRIHVTSDPDTGTRFTITLPREPPPGAADPAGAR
jgi:signal transduction histidine kinase